MLNERLKGLRLSDMVRFEINIKEEQIISLGKSIKEIEEKIKEERNKSLTSIRKIGELSATIILNTIENI